MHPSYPAAMDSTATTPQTTAPPAVPLAVSDQQNTALLDDTLTFLTASTPTNSGPQGRVEIERWEAVLTACARPGLAKIKQELHQLNALLADAKTPAHDIAEILASLGAETANVAEEAGGDYSGPLGNLSKLLIKAASSLSK
ncbi:MAG: hypothetical protein NVS3B25_00220 [Hymenobacter sp.]